MVRTNIETAPETMDLYSSILRASAEAELNEPDGSLDDTVARVLRQHAVLGQAPETGLAADRTMATLEYDLALIALSRQLGVEHAFFQEVTPESARQDTEVCLAERIADLAHLRSPPPAVPASSSADSPAPEAGSTPTSRPSHAGPPPVHPTPGDHIDH